jgi:hypothetical protein
MSRRALVWIGSPEGLQGSNSARYGGVLTHGMEDAGWSIEWVHLHRAVEDPEGVENLVRKTAESDLILFIAPLFVDGLPAPAIRAHEELAEARSTTSEGDRTPSFAALIHRGFIEPAHNATAIEICRQFVAAARLEWHGALALGGGGMPSRRAGRCLVAAREALTVGMPIPDEIRRRAERPEMPRWLYILGGNAMWRRVSKKRFGASKEGLRARPFAD